MLDFMKGTRAITATATVPLARRIPTAATTAAAAAAAPPAPPAPPASPPPPATTTTTIILLRTSSPYRSWRYGRGVPGHVTKHKCSIQVIRRPVRSHYRLAIRTWGSRTRNKFKTRLRFRSVDNPWRHTTDWRYPYTYQNTCSIHVSRRSMGTHHGRALRSWGLRTGHSRQSLEVVSAGEERRSGRE